MFINIGQDILTKCQISDTSKLLVLARVYWQNGKGFSGYPRRSNLTYASIQHNSRMMRTRQG